MPQNQEHAVARIHRDHDHLAELVNRIKGLCSERGVVENCRSCQPNKRNICQGNVEQLILSFVEATLKHHLVESVFMNQVPNEHRIAHMQAHVQIAEQLKSIRVVFSDDGNAVVAINGIDAALDSLFTHFKDFDQPLENYLLAAA